MFCTNCGKETGSGASFCPHCGRPVNVTAIPNPQAPLYSTKPEATQNGNTKVQAPKRKRRLLRILLLAAAIVIVCVFGLLLLYNLGVDFYLFGDFAEYTYVRADGVALNAKDIEYIKSIVEARDAEANPGDRGHGVPRLRLRNGQLHVKVRTNYTSEIEMGYLMSCGSVRVLTEDMVVIVDNEEIVSATRGERAPAEGFKLYLYVDGAAAQQSIALFTEYSGAALFEYDGNVIYQRVQYEFASSTLDENKLWVMSGNTNHVGMIAAAINHPLDIILREVTERPAVVIPQTETPGIVNQPTPTGQKPEPTGDQPELREGETLYQGVARLDHCDGVTVSFILSADQSEIRSVSFQLKNLSVTTTSGNSQTTITVDSVLSTLSGVYKVIDGSVDISAGAGTQLTLTGIGSQEATGTLQYTYTSYGTTTETFDLGTVPITVARQNP